MTSVSGILQGTIMRHQPLAKLVFDTSVVEISSGGGAVPA